jgi:hypothetical protein
MRILSICFVIIAIAQAAHADGTVIARATDQRGGLWVPCGVFYGVGWVVYERIRVVDGDDPGARFVAIHPCPADTLIGGEMRLVLRASQPGGQPDVYGKLPDLPKLYVAESMPESAPETKHASRLMDRAKADVEREFSTTATAGDWTVLTAHLEVRYRDGIVVGLRAQVAEALTCERTQEWIGYIIGSGGRGMPIPHKDRCVWPSTSEHSRLAKGLNGTMTYADHWFEVDKL